MCCEPESKGLEESLVNVWDLGAARAYCLGPGAWGLGPRGGSACGWLSVWVVQDATSRIWGLGLGPRE
jgi:hypothetical protein